MGGISAIRKSLLNNNKGFTLIEMAVVLIIIGLIVGAVVKGKDLVTSAKQKKLYTKFVQEWQMAYNSYYDRTGQILGDDDADPQATKDGNCGDGGSYADGDTLDEQLERVGLEPPTKGVTSYSNERMYKDSNGNQYTLTLEFCYASTISVSDGATTTTTGLGNFIRITSDSGFPAELGVAWDTIIDGEMNGQDGDFLYSSSVSSDPLSAGDWPSAADATVDTSGAILRLNL